jgi:sporulation protein YlmC with PRC-barrel domain
MLERQTMAWDMTETAEVIGSDKVTGTTVYSTSGEKMGSIERLMIEKTSGRVSYAVLSFGGFLGIGHDHYPVPWRTLNYDKTLGGYRTSLPKEKLKEAPKHAPDGHWDWQDPKKASAIEDYYKEH